MFIIILTSSIILNNEIGLSKDSRYKIWLLIISNIIQYIYRDNNAGIEVSSISNLLLPDDIDLLARSEREFRYFRKKCFIWYGNMSQ